MSNEKIKKPMLIKMSKEDLLSAIDNLIVKMPKKDLLDLYKILNASEKLKNIIMSESKKPKFKIELIDDSGIKEKNSNGGRTQTILFKVGNIFWKLIIHSESYSFQSYIRLYSGDGVNNWTLIKGGNPKEDYGIDISYQENYPCDIFSSIITNYKDIIKKMS